MPTSPQLWADTPFPLIPTPLGGGCDLSKEHGSKVLAQQMTHLHNCILRILNAIYNQAPLVSTPKDIKAMLLLVRLWHDELEHHHMTEEECFFPLIADLTGEKDIMEGNVDQHHMFEPGLERLGRYATETSVENYSWVELRNIIDDFGDILQQHLSEEIDTLLGLEKYDSKALLKAWDDTHKYVLRTCDSVSLFSWKRSIPSIIMC